MLYDIVPINKFYRGIERSLLATHLITQSNKTTNMLLEQYYLYLSDIDESPTLIGLIKLIDFCKALKKNHIDCEIIVYDTSTLANAWSYSLDLLGIDIVNEAWESLISNFELLPLQICQLLNSNGLCQTEKNASMVVSHFNNTDFEWKFCYVYKLCFE